MLRVCEFLGCGVETDISMPRVHDVILRRTNKMIYITNLICPLLNPCKNGCTFPSSQSRKGSTWYAENIFHSPLLIQCNFSVCYIILQKDENINNNNDNPLLRLIYFVPCTKLSVLYKLSHLIPITT